MITTNNQNNMIIFKIIDKGNQTLETFVNSDGFILIEVQPNGSNDYTEYQAVQLDYADAVGLSNELKRLIDEFEVEGTPEKP